MLAFLCVFSLALARSTHAAACTGTATYEIIFFNQITDTEPGAASSSRHYSPMVAVAHGSAWAPFSIGQTASDGVKDVAELGATTQILSEASAQGATTQVAATRSEYPQRVTSGYQVAQIAVDATRPKLSALTMIAPSPDWFTGFSNVSACNETSRVVARRNRRGQVLREHSRNDDGAGTLYRTSAFIHVSRVRARRRHGFGEQFYRPNSATSPRQAISYLSASSGASRSLGSLSDNNFLVGAMSARRVGATTTPTCTFNTLSSSALTHGVGFTLGLALIYALVWAFDAFDDHRANQFTHVYIRRSKTCSVVKMSNYNF